MTVTNEKKYTPERIEKTEVKKGKKERKQKQFQTQEKSHCAMFVPAKKDLYVQFANL